jgi:7SK snRNA methylphosphate capping enzyme
MRFLDPKWFRDLNVLDLGCNEGQLSLAIASHQEYTPKHILGVDIDSKLIASACSVVKRAIYDVKRQKKAQLSLNNYISKPEKVQENRISHNLFVPRTVSLPKSRPVDAELLNENSTSETGFPFNISFTRDDIMSAVALESHAEGPPLSASANRFDTVLCMSVAKWIHLNHGDAGLLECFRRMFALLVPGGRLVLEYQPWKSYVKNKAASPHIKQVFATIQIRPEDFEAILTSPQVGFEVEHRLGTPLELARAFDRPILVLRKPALQLSVISTEVVSSPQEEEEVDRSLHHKSHHGIAAAEASMSASTASAGCKLAFELLEGSSSSSNALWGIDASPSLLVAGADAMDVESSADATNHNSYKRLRLGL